MMKKSLTTLLLVFLIAGFAQAQYLSTISGTVTFDSQPMVDFGIAITIPDTEGVALKWTDSNGMYFTRAYIGTYNLAIVDTFLYNPLSYDVKIDSLGQHEICDFELTLREQDAAVTGNVSFDGFGVETTVYFLKISDDVDLNDFTQVETHFEVPAIAKKWASYSTDSDANGDLSLGMLYGKYVLYIESGEETLAHWGAIHVQGNMTIDPPIILKEKKLLSGTVVNADQYDYVKILAHSLNSGRPYTAVPNMETGEYTIEVAPGTYIVRCQAFIEEHLYMVYYDSVYTSQEAERVTVGDVNVPDINFNLPIPDVRDFTISGTVTSSKSGLPIVGAHLTFVSYNLPANLYKTYWKETDENGEYFVEGKTIMEEDSLYGFAYAENFFGEFYNNKMTHIDADPIVYHADENVTGIDFALDTLNRDSCFSISGSVSGEKGEIVGQGQITAFNTSIGVVSTQIDTNGNYTINVPANSTVYLQAWGGYNYLPMYYDNKDTWQDADPIIVTQDITGINFVLKKKAPRRFPLATITGYVEIGGNPKAAESLQGAVAYVRAEGATGWTDAGFVDAEGNFTLPAETNGNYEVMVTAKGCENKTIQVPVDLLMGDAKVTLNPTGIEDGKDIIVRSHQLFRAYPNPFNPTTTIRVKMAKTAEASLVIYNVMGQKVKTLHSGSLEKGTRNFKWNGTDNAGKQVASGLYFYQLKTQNNMQTKSVIFLK
jgi:hypothetical protein